MAELTGTAERPARPRRGVESATSVPIPVVGGGAPEDALPAHVLSHASGGRDVWSPPLETAPAEPEEAAWRCLGEVLDPELPISIVDLGLVYGLTVDGERARVDLTFTATACPCMEFIQEDVRGRLLRERWISEVEIRVVWDPPWTRERITEKGRKELRSLGVGA